MSADPEKAMEVVDDNDHESLDEEEEEETAGITTTKGGKAAGALTAEMLKNPALLQALQGRLDGVVGTSSGYIQNLPAPVKRRLKALKKLQFEATKVEAKFYEEIHELECKYHALYTPLYEKRATISKGDYEPNDEECEWPSEDEDDDDENLSEEMKAKAKLEKEEKSKENDEKNKDVKGVPEFWLTIFKNVELLQDMVQEHDEPALQALSDITVTFAKDPMAFTLHFHFNANDYFSNTVLTKEYIMKCEPDEEDPFSFEGPEIYKCNGCQINWKQGKNLTVETVKKKQKHKSKGSVRTITKTVKNDSFFNFFDPPKVPENKDDVNEDDEVDAETQELLTSDFEVGHYIRERIIPRAVLFFTGEALEEEDFDEEESDSDDDENGEEGSDDDDPDFDPSKVKGDLV